MQRPERLIGGSHAAFRTVRIGEIDRHEHGPAAVSRERRRGCFTLRLIAADEQQAARTLFFEQGCGGVAQSWEPPVIRATRPSKLTALPTCSLIGLALVELSSGLTHRFVRRHLGHTDLPP